MRATHRRVTPGQWLVDHPVEIVFAGIIGGAFVYLLRSTTDGYFVFGDWRLVRPSFRGMLTPYNDHLSITILAVYRALIEAFGYTYTPFRVVGLLCLLGVPVVYFVTTRRVLGPPLAALAALSMLAFGNIELYPEVLNHYLVLIGAVVCAAALNRGPRTDWVLAAALVLSLSAAGGGLAVAAACLVHSACTRPPVRRWLVVLVPCALWGCWWLTRVRGYRSPFRPAVAPSLSEALGYARDVAWAPFDHLGLGVPAITAVLALGYCAIGIWQLRRGSRAAASFLGWSTALGVWGMGLAFGRGEWIRAPVGQSAGVYFRYQLLALGFVLLAVVPDRPIRWPGWLPLGIDARWRVGGAIAVLVVGGLVAASIRTEVDSAADLIEAYGRSTKGQVVVLSLGSDVIEDDVTMGDGFTSLRAGAVHELIDRFGHPLEATSGTADQQLVDLGIAAARFGVARPGSCVPVAGTIDWPPGSGPTLRLWSDDDTWTVEVRRFGTRWVEIARARADDTIALRLPALGVEEPWQVRAEGACRT